ncbi:MAG: DUF2267 domain-containing protein [Cyanobacteria bacterium]|nr:DUF2267 domain-containing protein [Cyanobacteriota bacterium]MDA0866032.1 DUF2267 domain-containing protein [Cyanobacteriota bacterium]
MTITLESRNPKPFNPGLNADQTSFLEKVKDRANLETLYDAKEITEVVYRTMRDLMDHDTIEQVASEVDKPASQSLKKQLNGSISDLWQDSNPLVRWLSHLRPAFSQDGPLGIDDDRFLQRIEQEGSLPGNVKPLTAIDAVFTATKAELPIETQARVAECLPGMIRMVWQNA